MPSTRTAYAAPVSPTPSTCGAGPPPSSPGRGGATLCLAAALDLTLVDADGVELDMGGAVNGHRTGDEKYCPLDASGLSDEARHNRNLLARAMGGAIVNYPTEWWHWSYGDRYWALISKTDSAIYGPI